MRIGIPKETRPGERRVAATPDSIRKLRGLGFDVAIECGAGIAAGFADAAYEVAGATLVDAREAFAAPLVLKVRAPSVGECAGLVEGAALVCVLQLDHDPALEQALSAKKVTAVALERVPRSTRAQAMDVLSSTALAAGYRAVVEAAQHYQGFFGPQVTAAGSSPPARVLIIGAGVAGLAAIGAARAMGAEVRAFDTRSAAREQVESLGARFLEVEIQESGDGGGGYAKTMSKEFIAAEMALFRLHASEVDIVISTALVPGTKAPVLLPRDVVAALKPGSVVVDMAAEQGGNCELTRPGEIVVENGVTYVGLTDLPSRMGTVASRFFATNAANLLAETGGAAAFKIDRANDVLGPAIMLQSGSRPPPLPPAPPPVPRVVAKAPPSQSQPPTSHAKIMAPAGAAWGSTLGGITVLGVLFVLGRFAPPDFLQHSTVFVLACFVGWQVVWAVTPALHTPLMSVTNAISGIIIVGGMLQIGDTPDAAGVLGAVAVLFAAINVAGGFLVTQRMLRMFRRPGGAS